MNSRRRMSAPKLRGQHCTDSNEYFDRGSNRHQNHCRTGIKNHCRSAQPMSLMGQNPKTSSAHVSFRQNRTHALH
jgi:hypothetical protein